MKILLRVILLLPFALPVTFILVHWPLAFGVVGGGLCCLALVVMAVQIASSGPRVQAPDQRAAASVDGVPVRNVEVLQ